MKLFDLSVVNNSFLNILIKSIASMTTELVKSLGKDFVLVNGYVTYIKARNDKLCISYDVVPYYLLSSTKNTAYLFIVKRFTIY